MGYIGVYNPLILTFYQHFRPGISNSPTTIPWPSWLVPPKLCLRWASVSGFRVSPPHGDVVSVFITARLVGRHGQSWASDVCNIWGGIIPIIFFACSTASHFSHWKKKRFPWHDMNPYNFMFSSPAFNSNIYQNWLWNFHSMMWKNATRIYQQIQTSSLILFFNVCLFSDPPGWTSTYPRQLAWLRHLRPVVGRVGTMISRWILRDSDLL